MYGAVNSGLDRGDSAWVWGVCYLVFPCNGRLFRTSTRSCEALYTVKDDSRDICNQDVCALGCCDLFVRPILFTDLPIVRPRQLSQAIPCCQNLLNVVTGLITRYARSYSNVSYSSTSNSPYRQSPSDPPHRSIGSTAAALTARADLTTSQTL